MTNESVFESIEKRPHYKKMKDFIENNRSQCVLKETMRKALIGVIFFLIIPAAEDYKAWISISTSIKIQLIYNLLVGVLLLWWKQFKVVMCPLNEI